MCVSYVPHFATWSRIISYLVLTCGLCFAGTTTLENVDEGPSTSLPWEVVAGPGLHAVQLSASNGLNDKTHGDEQTWDGMSDDPSVDEAGR